MTKKTTNFSCDMACCDAQLMVNGSLGEAGIQKFMQSESTFTAWLRPLKKLLKIAFKIQCLKTDAFNRN